MKNAIKLLVLAGALLSVGAMAGKGTAFNFYFPAYVAIYTNVTQVDFFSTTGTEGALYQNEVSGYYEGTSAGVLSCIDDNLSTFTGNDLDVSGSTSSSASITCNFAPNAVTSDNSFSVTGYDNAGDPPTDGELLIITNSSTFNVSADVDSNTIASGETIYAIPAYADSNGDLQGSTTTGDDVTDISFSNADALATQYSNAKVIPLLFYASVDILNTDPIATAESISITWTASAY